MKKKTLNQKENMQFIVLAIIVLAIIVGVSLIQQRTNWLPKASAPTNYSPSINSTKDLDMKLKDLDNTNLDQLDKSILDNSSDASSL